MTAPGDIKVDIADGIATLRVANPARRHAISTLVWKKIAAFAEGRHALAEKRSPRFTGN